MFCVIQEIQRKKPNTHGGYKELEAYSPIELYGKPKYSYRHTGGKFERPIRTAYKVSIHDSRRVNGAVTKKQYVVTTVDYYSLAEFWIGDCVIGKKLESIADSLNISIGDLWDLINAKVDPLQERIKAEYQKTEEYKTHAKHRKILDKYQKARSRFAKKYGVDADEYDYCYNIFGEVMNQKYLAEIIESDRQRKQEYSSYRKRSYSNYGNYDYSKLFGYAGSAYTDAETAMLKKFYKALSMKFHPDMNPDTNTTGEMQLLNKLKEQWGL